jgi:hypothetical protein
MRPLWVVLVGLLACGCDDDFAAPPTGDLLRSVPLDFGALPAPPPDDLSMIMPDDLSTVDLTVVVPPDLSTVTDLSEIDLTMTADQHDLSQTD